MKVGPYDIELSNSDKILFPKSHITKGDLVSYYQDIASLALPYYENRPLTMQRCPDGIDHQNFMQKEAPDYFPAWIDRYNMPKKGGHVRCALVNNEATLVYLANQACITFHLGLSKVDKIEYPNYLIFDLDPSTEDLSLLKNVVRIVKDLLDQLGLKSFIQTTGSRGFHIYIPLKREFTFETVHGFAKDMASYLAGHHPQEITIEQSKEKREKRVLLDYARNSFGIPAVAPYSVRTKEKAPIATPLHWEELEDPKLTSQSFHLKNIKERLAHTKDPWKEMNASSIFLTPAQEKLASLRGS